MLFYSSVCRRWGFLGFYLFFIFLGGGFVCLLFVWGFFLCLFVLFFGCFFLGGWLLGFFFEWLCVYIWGFFFFFSSFLSFIFSCDFIAPKHEPPQWNHSLIGCLPDAISVH